MKTARGAQNERKARHAGGARKRKGAVRIWVAIVAVTLLTLLFAWALCRAAAQADRHIAETFMRRQEEALGAAEEEDDRKTAREAGRMRARPRARSGRPRVQDGQRPLPQRCGSGLRMLTKSTD